MGCPETLASLNTEVDWNHWHRLALKLDEVAAELNTPGYDPLAGDASQPFIAPDVIDYTLYQWFQVDRVGNCPQISDRLLYEGGFPGGGGNVVTNWPHQFMDDYAQNDRLWFVYKEDDKCFCKSIFKIIKEGNGYTLQTSDQAPQHGCCPFYSVPEIGDLLDSSQYFIPSQWACAWGDVNGIEKGNPIPWSDPSPIWVYTICAGGGMANQVEWKLEDIGAPGVNAVSSGKWGLIEASRMAAGCITWPILKEHMDTILERINTILDPDNNDGVKPFGISSPEEVSNQGSDVYRKDCPYAPDPNCWFKMGSTCCTIDYDAFMGHLCKEGVSCPAKAVPGTLIEDDDVNNNCGPATKGEYQFKRPWLQLTGGAQNCDNGEIKVYAETINALYEFISKLPDYIWPYDTFQELTPESQQCSGCSSSSLSSSSFQFTSFGFIPNDS